VWDPVTPLAAKGRCAFYILDQTRRAIETDNILPRLEELERAAEITEKPTDESNSGFLRREKRLSCSIGLMPPPSS